MRQQIDVNVSSSAKRKDIYSPIILPVEGKLPENLEQYINLTSNNYIRLVCEPLKAIQVGYFLYAKRFHDSSYIYLTNLPEWQKFYFRNHYYLQNEFDDPDENYPTGAFMWSGLNSHEIYNSLRDKFNIDHGLTIIQKYQDCTEFFHFGALQNNNILNIYLNNLDIFKRFICYFKDKTAELLEAAATSRIILPKRKNQQIANVCLMQDAILIFKELTKINRYYVSPERSDIYLTKREMECLHWYVHDKTAEEVGMILGLSKRTVETHLLSAKNKTNYFKKGQLIRKFNTDLIY